MMVESAMWLPENSPRNAPQGTVERIPSLRTMNKTDFKLRGEFIALCDLLKTTGVAESGGDAKALIAAGKVQVDGQLELRKAAKIRAGQLVTYAGQSIRIKPAPNQPTS